MCVIICTITNLEENIRDHSLRILNYVVYVLHAKRYGENALFIKEDCVNYDVIYLNCVQKSVLPCTLDRDEGKDITYLELFGILKNCPAF